MVVGASIFFRFQPRVAGEVRLFKPLYYLGCKTSFVEPIVNAINEVDPSGGRVCDLFAGSGAVATAVALARNVTTVDIQEYSRAICSAQLRPSALTKGQVAKRTKSLTDSELAKRLSWCFQPLIDYERQCMQSALRGRPGGVVALIESNPIVVDDRGVGGPKLALARKEVRSRLAKYRLTHAKGTTVSSYFGGVYFSFEQAIMLDVALSQADEAPAEFKDTLVAATLSVASVLVNTVGKQFAQPLRPRDKAGVIKTGIGEIIHRDRSVDAANLYQGWLTAYAGLPKTSRPHNALKMDYHDALVKFGNEFSVVYADPPYTRDHYSRFYHVLETMCLRDSPRISMVTKNGSRVPSRGLYREDRHQSPFCIRSEAPKALSNLFEEARKLGLPIVLSYSPHESGDGTHPRVMSASDIVAIAKKHYPKVEVDLLDGSTHNKLNKAELGLVKRRHAEMIVKCRA